MKKVLFITIAIFIYTSGYNQQTEPQQQLTKQEYLQKSKKQKTTAWIFFPEAKKNGALTTIEQKPVQVNENKRKIGYFPIQNLLKI